MARARRLTDKELGALIGRHGAFTPHRCPLCFPVVIVLARWAYGRNEVEISPIGGTGTAWVDFKRVKI